MQKKQNYNSSLLKKIIITKSLVAVFASGLFAVNTPSEYLSSDKNKSLLLKPRKKFDDETYDKFILGRSFFTIPWVEAPSVTTARDGLGPLFNANTCTSCHPANGRGNLYTKNNFISRALVARVSRENKGTKSDEETLKYKGFIPDEVYGSQISLNGVHKVPFEGKINVSFEEIKINFPDGEVDTILKPKYNLSQLNYGKLKKGVNISYRLAPTLNGMGLIELISNEDILANEDIEDKDKDGISGKANWVYSELTKKMELGKYTWKASAPFVKEQVANAAINDMGLTTTIHLSENCTSAQKECLEAPSARDKIDLPDNRLDAITFYLKNLKAYKPKHTKKYEEGLKVFESVGCTKCHISSFDTKKGFKVNPFSDFLLHDMGEGLSDGRVEFKAGKSEFRTAPLWGLALHEKINKKKPRLLHDGRARDFQEAILWHGGEGLNAKNAYMSLPKEKREELLEFLKGL